MQKKIRVAISYRVIQEWRAPVFERLALIEDLELVVFYGDDFKGTKVVGIQNPDTFRAEKLKTIKFQFKTINGQVCISLHVGLYRQLKKFKPDVIITEGASNFINNLACYFYARKHGAKIIQWGLGELRNHRKSFQRKLLDLFFVSIEKHSDAAIAYSTIGADYYKRIGLAQEKIFTAVNVVDTEQRYNQFKSYCESEGKIIPSPLPAQFNILFVGALTAYKNIDSLVYAFSNLKNLLGRNVKLTLVGDGSYREDLEKLVCDLRLQDNVEFAGHVNHGVGRYFYDASIFVLPGLGGLAVSDALVHGVPVLCYLGDGCEQDLIQQNQNGIIMENNDSKSIFDYLDMLYNNREELSKMRNHAQKFHEGNYNISSYIQTFDRAIRFVCSGA